MQNATVKFSVSTIPNRTTIYINKTNTNKDKKLNEQKKNPITNCK